MKIGKFSNKYKFSSFFLKNTEKPKKISYVRKFDECSTKAIFERMLHHSTIGDSTRPSKELNHFLSMNIVFNKLVLLYSIKKTTLKILSIPIRKKILSHLFISAIYEVYQRLNIFSLLNQLVFANAEKTTYFCFKTIKKTYLKVKIEINLEDGERVK